MEKYIEESIVSIYNCKVKTQPLLTWGEFYQNIGNYEREIVKRVIKEYERNNKLFEPFPNYNTKEECDDSSRMKHYKELMYPPRRANTQELKNMKDNGEEVEGPLSLTFLQLGRKIQEITHQPDEQIYKILTDLGLNINDTINKNRYEKIKAQLYNKGINLDQMQEFGKKRVKDLSEDFKYLLTLNEF